jgi:hypothetical protein
MGHQAQGSGEMGFLALAYQHKLYVFDAHNN